MRKVEALRAELGVSTGLTGRALDDRLAQELVDRATFRAALVGLAGGLPVAGLIGGVGSAVWQASADVELAMAVAEAYRSPLADGELRRRAMALAGVSAGDLRGRAVALGVRAVAIRALGRVGRALGGPVGAWSAWHRTAAVGAAAIEAFGAIDVA